MSNTFVGMPAFPEAAKIALADTQLRRNLAHATRVIRTKRDGVVAELPDWQELRLAGAAIKDRTLRHLDGYLEEFEAAALAAGAQVHWARDGAEANAIVADLVRQAGADEVVKVKSMATQEMGMNEALAEVGIAALETDLAELIVQLNDDLPSHILVPAIHRNRAEIREIFLREMPGAPADLTDVPRELAAAARTHLRRKFLSAKVGISGANFAIAETGTLVVVESEGNGRMCLTLPETLISVVGVEKILPTFSDLGCFLQRCRARDRGADESLHHDVDRGGRRRRPADGAHRAGRQRADPGAGRSGGPAGVALHPLLGLPELLPGLRTDRWTRLRLGLPRPDRRDPQPAAQRGRGRSGGEVAALRLDAVRALLRGVPGADRHPDGWGHPGKGGDAARRNGAERGDAGMRAAGGRSTARGGRRAAPGRVRPPLRGERAGIGPIALRAAEKWSGNATSVTQRHRPGWGPGAGTGARRGALNGRARDVLDRIRGAIDRPGGRGSRVPAIRGSREQPGAK